ncbi:unnamed protein product [Brachionus calyciflorus]|uniref:Uncharacterized protein n=1 Tax=Brachionus calyciflorus TaxID=104777 RepID=A0A814D8N7_9BILA|nr:unnamed protein product [Brachionus calyciflorus]
MKLNLFLALPLFFCIQLIISQEVISDKTAKRQALFNGEIGQNTVNQVSIGAGFFKNGKRRITRQFLNQFSGPIKNNIQRNVTSAQAAAAVMNSITNFFSNTPAAPHPMPLPKQLVATRSKGLIQQKSNQNRQFQSNKNGVGQQPMIQGIINNQSTQVRHKKKMNPFRNQLQSIQK